MTEETVSFPRIGSAQIKKEYSFESSRDLKKKRESISGRPSIAQNRRTSQHQVLFPTINNRDSNKQPPSISSTLTRKKQTEINFVTPEHETIDEQMDSDIENFSKVTLDVKVDNNSKPKTGNSAKESRTKTPKQIPQGLPLNYFSSEFLREAAALDSAIAEGKDQVYTEVSRTVSLSVLKNVQQKCNLSENSIRWKLAIKLVIERKLLNDIQSKEEKTLVDFLREKNSPKSVCFPDVPVPQFVMLKAKFDLLSSTIIKHIFEMKILYRSKKHQETLDEILKKFPTIGKYTKVKKNSTKKNQDLRYQLYDVMSYEEFSKNATIIQPGNVASSCYYILSGVCRLQTIPQGKRFQALFPPTTPALDAIRTNKLNEETTTPTITDNLDKQSSRQPVTISILTAGDCIDLEKRSLKVIVESMTAVKVLRVDKSQFIQVEKQNWLNSIPNIKSLPRYTIDCIARTGALRKYSQKSCIIRSVISGEAVAYRLVTFIKTPSIRSTFFKPRYTLIPYNTEQMASPTAGQSYKVTTLQDIVFELVPIGQIPIKSCFPHGLGVKVGVEKDKKKKLIREAIESIGFDKHTVIVGNSQIANGYCQGSYDYDGGYSFSGSCECFVISRSDMIQLVGGIAKLENILIELPGMPEFNEKELQQSYLSSRGWHIM